MEENHDRPATLEDLTMPNGWVWDDPIIAAECKGLLPTRGNMCRYVRLVRGAEPHLGCPLTDEELAARLRISLKGARGYRTQLAKKGLLRVVAEEGGGRRLLLARRLWDVGFDVEPHVLKAIDAANAEAERAASEPRKRGRR